MESAEGLRRRWLCPEVIQSSQMDCGPATAKALLEGHRRPASYGRLRETCRTDVDGTAIGDLERLLQQLDLPVEQVMLPIDHVLLAEAEALPCIAVVLTGVGQTHYVVVWRAVGGMVQVMDPSVGRRWLPARSFEDTLYRHEHTVDAAAWREWAGGDDFTRPLAARLRHLGVEPRARIDAALDDPSWRALAALDAATRFARSLTRGAPVRDAAALIDALVRRARGELDDDAVPDRPTVPERAWSVWPAGVDDDGDSLLTLRGAVLLRVPSAAVDEPDQPDTAAETDEAMESDEAIESDEAEVTISASTRASIESGDPAPWRRMLAFVRAQGRHLAPALALGTIGAATLVALEGLLFLGLLRAADGLGGFAQLPLALVVGLVFLAALGVLEAAVATGTRSLGRGLELRLRTAFLRKIPRLGDRYFSSRLRSDMAERAHSVVPLRDVPGHVVEMVESFAGLVVTTLAIALVFPGSALLAVLLAVVAVAVPLGAQPLLIERGARLRAHAGTLSRFYLDALLGLTALRAHGAEPTLRREHEVVLRRWIGTGLSFERWSLATDAVQATFALGCAAALIVGHVEARGVGGGVLLLAYWSLGLPALGASFALAVQRVPEARSLATRLVEPLDAPEDPPLDTLEDAVEDAVEDATEADARLDVTSAPDRAARRRGVALRLEGLSVTAGGHSILRDVDARIAPGERIAVLGASGAGKSTLLGLFLGWSTPATGRLLVDDAELMPATLRRRTAWVDPQITLWNRSLLDNLRYGAPLRGAPPLETICSTADLDGVLDDLPHGLATLLGEGGGLVSGGEGQRVRLGRALSRVDADLVLLDEPFRGLEADRRGALLEQALAWWDGATILCATHDVASASRFDRIAVLEEGRLVELGTPSALRARPGSRYRARLDTEERRRRLWRDGWRRLTMIDGKLVDA